MSGVKVKYKWLLFGVKKDDVDYLEQNLDLEGKKDRFSINPDKGYFEGLQTQEFVITYDGSTKEKYFELDQIQYANLVVEDIPIKSIQNPSRGL